MSLGLKRRFVSGVVVGVVWMGLLMGPTPAWSAASAKKTSPARPAKAKPAKSKAKAIGAKAKAKAKATGTRRSKALMPVIVISGPYQERSQGASPFAASVPTLSRKIAQIRKAADDKRVKALWLWVRGPDIGWAKLAELRKAIAEFRKSGKKVFCMLEMAERADYLLAAAADEICLVPSGSLFVAGLRAEVLLWTGLLEDHLKIHGDFIQMGKYKGASEPYTARKLSEPFKRQLNLMLDDLYGQMRDMIAKSRRLSTKQVTAILDQGVFTAKDAMEAGLVDRVAYADEHLKAIRKQLGVKVEPVRDYGKTKRTSSLSFMNVWSMFAPPKRTLKTGKPKIAVIHVDGMIVPGRSTETLFGGRVVGSETIAKAFRQARDEVEVIAVVLRVDSPGGSAIASDLIWREVIRTNRRKVVVASFSDVAASGGYYVAMGARKIVAQPGTITGSIGVFGGKLVLKGLFDMLHLGTEQFTRGRNAGMFSLTSKFSPSEREALTRLMKDTYDQFVGKAALGRKRTLKAMEAAAQGRIWTGRMALKQGLVDQLGGLDDAIQLARNMAGVAKDDKVDIINLPFPKTYLEVIMDRMEGGMGMGAAPAIVAPLAERLGTLDTLMHLQRERVFTMMPFKLTIR